ncbi:SusC/RagA family TonB-linked outer membrane protein [Phocaeicola abscessus]|uniref:SusC/RagA family TonB-linked outer membrane protein n=1 Tax=Phocaeicola abscessus TaxID=555313 RepID=UPI00055FB050|nr:SusC/RagA family TonB-linked outer membrane protein [Phocaeicola abscessus]
MLKKSMLVGGAYLLSTMGFLSFAPTVFASSASFAVERIQQQVSVSGIVKDSNGESLPGVNVVVKGTSNGVITDLDGRFQLNAPHDAILVVTYIGYVKQEVKVKGGELKINMVEDSQNLSEVIVTGVAAGTPKQKLGFSIEKVSADKLLKVPATDAASALQGKVAGLRITKTSGAPGSESDIQLRGVKTIFGSSNPLFIVDGVLTENGLADINAEDIESIEVLKGAAASSLYGSRAANGVVSIMTKRGTSMGAGKVQVDFRTEYGKNFLGFVPEQSKSTNHLIQDGNVVYGVTDPDKVYDNPYPVVYDHIDQFFNPGNYFTTHLAVKGTTQNNKMSIYTSIQTTDEGGVVSIVDGAKRANIRLNVDYRILDNLVFTTSNLYSRIKTDNRANAAFGSLYRSDPAADLLASNTDGTPYLVNVNKLNQIVNPLYNMLNSKDESVSEKLLSYFSLKYDPTDYLTFSASYGTTRTTGESLYLAPKGRLRYDLTTDPGYISRSMWKNTEQTVTFDASFYKRFGDFNTRFKIQYLYESSYSSSLSGGGSALGMGGMDITSVNLSSEQFTNSAIYKSIANNIAGMFVMDYKDKYILDALVRRDASSLFGADVRWQTFYRVAGAWRITQDFKIPGINEWKLRASYGVAGLRPPYEAQYEVFALQNGVPGNMETLGNSNLKPSFSKETEIGTDIRFLDRFNFSVNYSIANNTDQILKVPVTPLSGAAYQWQNAGTIQTKVWEATLSADVLNSKDWGLNFGLTFDKVKQKITKLNCTPYMLDGTRFRIEEGVDFGVLYLDKFARSLDEVANQVPEGRTVDEVFAINNQGFVVERSKIGTVDETPVKVKDDKGNIVALPTKSMTPNFNMNLNTTLTYKGFTFYMLWGYQNGGTVYNHAVRYITEPKLFDQAGKPWNEVKAAPYYSNGGQSIGLLGWDNDVLLYDADFLKLREVSLSYDFKIKALQPFVKNMKVSLIGRNLLTFTKYPGYDPEGVKADKSKGVDSNAFRLESNEQYPLYRTITGSIAFTF